MSESQVSNRTSQIHDLATAFARRLDADELIPFALERSREILGADGVSILLLDREKRELYFPYVAEGDAEAGRRLAEVRLPADRGIAGAVLQSGRSELITDVRRDPRFSSTADDRTGTATGSLLAAPLLSESAPLGVIEAVRRAGAQPFSEAEKTQLELLAGSIAVALENAGRFAEIKQVAALLRAQNGALRQELARNDRFAEIIAVSPAMSEVFRLTEAAAASIKSVLILGETGTGKELVARAIHRIGARAEQPFVSINCAAVPEGLLESELFGHRRGAFSGALSDQVGLFRAASGGTLFLDEIGEMPIQMQAKLLRVLQEGEIKPVGDARSYKVDVRVISATNRDLEAGLAARAFREDLFYRLNTFTIRLPPLRDRREDIPLMAARFLDMACRGLGKRVAGFSPQAQALLESADWPGNVRQLQNEIDQAVALAAEGELIGPQRFSRRLGAAAPARNGFPESSADTGISDSTAAQSEELGVEGSLAKARAEFETRFIAGVLARHRGNVSHAAIALGVSRVTLQKKMKEYSLRGN
ncbi:MAG TPA: sigma 54-interacting transcriptional regulator [Candidatus Binataceae bacterium]|nr:sigma 54-interacting transcriptional regulator [Candidatus Binataceae bacterium]